MLVPSSISAQSVMFLMMTSLISCAMKSNLPVFILKSDVWCERWKAKNDELGKLVFGTLHFFFLNTSYTIRHDWIGSSSKLYFSSSLSCFLQKLCCSRIGSKSQAHSARSALRLWCEYSRIRKLPSLIPLLLQHGQMEMDDLNLQKIRCSLRTTSRR